MSSEHFDEEARKFLHEKDQSSGYLEEAKEAKEAKVARIQAQPIDTNRLSPGNQLQWKNLPITYLPTGGLFYPEDFSIIIKAAEGGEIRHWSAIDENDMFSVDEKLNFVLERCCRIKCGDRPMSFKDLKDVDRFFVILAIHEITFMNNENRLYIDVEFADGPRKVPITKDTLDFYRLDEKLMKFYSPENKCFVFNSKSGENYFFYIPSCGVTTFIKQYVKEQRQSNKPFDETFINFIPFIFSDWRTLNKASYQQAYNDYRNWGIEKISFYTKFAEKVEIGIKPEVKVSDESGAEVSAPLNFHGGIKSLFIISDILGELD